MNLSKEKSQEIFAGLVGMLHRNLIEEQNLLSLERDNEIVDGFGGPINTGEFSVTLRFNSKPMTEPILFHRKKPIQEIRDGAVEMAKCDVAELTVKLLSYDGQLSAVYDNGYLQVEFIVNKEKRTVVALLDGLYCSIGKKLRGIAKCAPGDCFNVHIGKAIALRRALGLEVPAEYLTAPQPTEVRVGDVIYRQGNFERTTGNRTITKISTDTHGDLYYNTAESVGSTGPESIVRIIDDSRDN
jgi:hypothetical protein